MLAALTLTACSRDPQAEGPRHGPSSGRAGDLPGLAAHPLQNPWQTRQDGPAGPTIVQTIETAGFFPAHDNTDAPMRTFGARFGRKVRSVDATG